MVATMTIAAIVFGTINAQFSSAIPYESQSRKPTKSTHI